VSTQGRSKDLHFSDPPAATSLFGSPKWSWLWLVARLYVGYTWFTSGWGKLSNPAWVQTGEALKGFWVRAVAIPEAPARRSPLIGTGFLFNPCWIQALTPGLPSWWWRVKSSLALH
jgi:thiosulfate dehydrogenase [quinone] large subunit